jgi:phosphatidyl-myo-inositol alpha-mannosyltransferase
MKIGLVCPYDLFRGGGVQEHVLAQADELKRRGHDVKILTPKVFGFNGNKPKDIIFVGNSAKVRTPIKTSHEWGVTLKRDHVAEILAAEKFDLIHIHEPEVPILGAQIVSVATCPIVATFHALMPDTFAGWTVETIRVAYSKTIYDHLTAITSVTNDAASFVRERTGRDVAIIPNGIDLKKFNTTKPKTRRVKSAKLPKKTILYVGRLEKRKGVRYLIKAYEKLVQTHPDIQLVIAGDGEEREKLEDIVKFRDIPGVKFLGFVDEKKKIDLLRNADLFCAPALYGESFGIVLLEALAVGVVIVAGNNPGYSSVLVEQGSSSLVDPKDTPRMAHRLETMLFDEQQRTDWLNWAKDYVKQFDYKNVVDEYVKLYGKILKES